jgi:hypothetical protein
MRSTVLFSVSLASALRTPGGRARPLSTLSYGCGVRVRAPPLCSLSWNEDCGDAPVHLEAQLIAHKKSTSLPRFEPAPRVVDTIAARVYGRAHHAEPIYRAATDASVAGAPAVTERSGAPVTMSVKELSASAVARSVAGGRSPKSDGPVVVSFIDWSNAPLAKLARRARAAANSRRGEQGGKLRAASSRARLRAIIAEEAARASLIAGVRPAVTAAARVIAAVRPATSNAPQH